MLATQVQYWNYMETQRHNKATESQAKAELQETNRSNLVREGISKGTLDESVRHNKATEQISWDSLDETRRHNKAQEEIGFANVNETVRHNKEYETLYPYMRDNYQMQTTTGYVDTATQSGDRIAVTPAGKAGVAALTLAGMLAGSDVSHSSKGQDTYGHFSTKGTNKRPQTSATHYGKRPTMSDSDRNKYIRF